MTVGCEFWMYRKSEKKCKLKLAYGWTMFRDTDSIAGDKTGYVIWDNYKLDGGDLNCE